MIWRLCWPTDCSIINDHLLVTYKLPDNSVPAVRREVFQVNILQIWGEWGKWFFHCKTYTILSFRILIFVLKINSSCRIWTLGLQYKSKCGNSGWVVSQSCLHSRTTMTDMLECSNVQMLKYSSFSWVRMSDSIRLAAVLGKVSISFPLKSKRVGGLQIFLDYSTLLIFSENWNWNLLSLLIFPGYSWN